MHSVQAGRNKLSEVTTIAGSESSKQALTL